MCWELTRNSKHGSHRREYRRRVEDQEVNEYDDIEFLSADIEGRNDRPRQRKRHCTVRSGRKEVSENRLIWRRSGSRWWMMRGTTRSCSGEKIGDAK